MRVIQVAPYNPQWPAEYEREKQLILASIPIQELLVHHIGSTSVQGLAAKPIIDLLIEVRDVEELDHCTAAFESLGYDCKGEFGIPDRRYFQKGESDRTHQIHAFEKGSIGARRHLAFRDYLIAHNAIANEYAELKYQAARACENTIEVYCEFKNKFIVFHEKRALAWVEDNI
ncbi:Dephospho-CoA kinase [BD1-7 clade bacterium]|uniref:Dephospho-CoA kinase n=1 Tax=BD1-7 clade bacterium TaxID=2029982 RepID=A0A5S9NQ53_9GAMM|nr:Dephospho-CoA kinase [BD1-7 clade bacterium]